MTSGSAIEPAPTSTAAFLGYAPSGVVNQALLVTSFAEFEHYFGGLAADSPMSYAVLDFFNNGGVRAWVVRVVGDPSTPDQPAPADFRGSKASGEGVWALDQASDIGLLCVPGQSDPDLLGEFASYCKRRRAFFIADIPRDVDTARAARGWVTGLRDRTLRRYSATYFPWLLEPDPLNNDIATRRSPTGAVAGLFARIDTDYGVWTIAAGSNARLIGVTGLDATLTDAESLTLSRVGVNPIRSVTGAGTAVWGARTLLASAPDVGERKYVPVRRMALFLEKSIENGTQWAAFEPNDEPTWRELRRAVAAFLHGLLTDGAFQGDKPCSAYFVKCGENSTSWDDLEAGVVNIVVGFALVRSGEFSTVTVRVPCGRLGH